MKREEQGRGGFLMKRRGNELMKQEGENRQTKGRKIQIELFKSS